jgi:hypothetical protein
MKLNEYNNVNYRGSSSLFIIKENISIFCFLVLFTAINVILMSFCFDILVYTFSQLGEDTLLMVENICPITPEVTPCISMKQDLSSNGLSIFDAFIKLFNKNPSGYGYFPSYFQSFTDHTKNTLPFIINTTVDTPNLDIAKQVSNYNQYLIIERHNNHLNDLLNDL